MNLYDLVSTNINTNQLDDVVDNEMKLDFNSSLANYHI